MMSYEGVDVAKRFNQMGIDVFCTQIPHDVRRYRRQSSGRTERPRDGGCRRTTGCAAGPAACGRIWSRAESRWHDWLFGRRRRSARLRFMVPPMDARTSRCRFMPPAPVPPAPPVNAPPLFIAVASDDKSVGYQGSNRPVRRLDQSRPEGGTSHIPDGCPRFRCERRWRGQLSRSHPGVVEGERPPDEGRSVSRLGQLCD